MSYDNFTLLWPSGAPYKGIFESAKATLFDERFVKIPNFIGGSDHTMDSGAKVRLGGDGTNLLNLYLPVSLAYSAQVERGVTLTIDGTSGNAGIVQWAGYAEARFASASVFNFASGASSSINADWNIESGAKIRVKSGGTQQVDAGAAATNASVLGTQYTGTQPAATADPGANNIACATNQPKAGGYLTTDGAGNAAIADGYNVASVTLNGANDGWTVTLARAMANTNYQVTATYQYNNGSGQDATNYYVPKVKIASTTGFEIKLWNVNGAAAATANTTGLGVAFHVMGRQ